MLQQLTSHSPDLKKLDDEGFQLSVNEHGGHLIVRRVPYLTPDLKVEFGTLVTVLNLASPSRVGSPPDHTIYFQGQTPHNADGTPLTAIINNSNKAHVGGVDVDHYFSSKPPAGNYRDYYDKIRTYAEILGSQARVVDPKVYAQTKRN
jgi:hypothetical protein